MKASSFSVLMFVFFCVGCAHSPNPVPSPAPPVAPPQTRQVMVVSDSAKIPPTAAEMSVQSENKGQQAVRRGNTHAKFKHRAKNHGKS